MGPEEVDEVMWGELSLAVMLCHPLPAFTDATATVSHEGESPDRSQGRRQPDVHLHLQQGGDSSQ